ncbi:hypothetical protein ACTXT7_014330 [Hymenolepis weldensis]
MSSLSKGLDEKIHNAILSNHVVNVDPSCYHGMTLYAFRKLLFIRTLYDNTSASRPQCRSDIFMAL